VSPVVGGRHAQRWQILFTKRPRYVSDSPDGKKRQTGIDAEAGPKSIQVIQS